MNQKRMTKQARKIIKYEQGNVVNEYQFPILELPTILICVIFAKLPLKAILSCRGVCKAFLKLIEDPYFAETHLKEALGTSATIIVQENHFIAPYFLPYMLELDYTPKKSPCNSSDHHFYNQQTIYRQIQGVPLRDVKCCFLADNAVLTSSCNGLICLVSHLLEKPTYCICNPVTGECITLPYPASLTSDYVHNHSAFGFCPKTEQYKVIRFMSSESEPTLRSVALVHTLGTSSWRNIGETPYYEIQESFDGFLDGKLHLITGSDEISETVYSFDLETEKFNPVPMPACFSPEYFSKISWISVGVINGCLCLCCTSADTYFEVFTMQKYGVGESWIKKFAIDIKFYCGLGAVDLQRPIKILNNGEFLFISKFNTLVSYSPQKRSFREIKRLSKRWAHAIAYVPSFVSLRSRVFKSGITYEKIKLGRPIPWPIVF